MLGYRNNPKANDEVFFYKDGKRYFRTGDMGRMVEGKFLKITGRIKEQYKLENGKYVVPAPLEDGITRSQFIAQALLYGDNKKFNIAVIVPDIVELRGWMARQPHFVQGSGELSLEELLCHEEVRKLFSSELQHVCSTMKSYERPLRWAAIFEPFSQENQMLTPKMSLRRNNVVKAYKDLIDELYADAEAILDGSASQKTLSNQGFPMGLLPKAPKNDPKTEGL
jgi:long-chain acyl-CoA synthetase